MHTLDLEPFKHSGTNITGMRLVKPLDEEFRNTVAQWTDNLSPLEPDDKAVLPESIQVWLGKARKIGASLFSITSSSVKKKKRLSIK